nr:MAG TPA: hypothetical protein [Caudoviricetes sp.]
MLSCCGKIANLKYSLKNCKSFLNDFCLILERRNNSCCA